MRHRGQARFLSGACDPLFTPRPLGPFLDVAEQTDGRLEELVAGGAMPHDIALALARELGVRGPTILVLEDVHWADDASLDVLRLLARRLRSVRALVLISYRETARRLDNPEALVTGLQTLGAAAAMRGEPSGVAQLEACLQMARDAGLENNIGRIHLLLGITGCRERSLDRMEAHAASGLAYCEERDLGVSGRLLLAMHSWIALERADWQRAADIAGLALTQNCTLSSLQVRVDLGLLRARRGDPEPGRHWCRRTRRPNGRASSSGCRRRRPRGPKRRGWKAAPARLPKSRTRLSRSPAGSVRPGRLPSSPGGGGRAASTKRHRLRPAARTHCSSPAIGPVRPKRGVRPAAHTRRH